MLQLLLFMAFMLSGSLTQGQTNYALVDLEALVNEGSTEEFFKHALDVRPSERQQQWKAMVVKMGDAYSKKLLARTALSKAEFKKIEGLYAWPTLKSDDVFRARRQEIGLKFLATCLKDIPPCWDQVRSFWEVDKSDPEVAFRLSELLIKYPEAPITTWTFLDVALKSPLSEFYCKKDFVMSALWGKIEIDYIRLGPRGDLMTKIDRTIHPDCLLTLIEEARKRLRSPVKASDRELAYQILKSQLKATQDIEDFFYTVYLLENPSQGELFNYSWNRVKLLGATSARREQVLKTLKELDPLPDTIFSSVDKSKRKVLLLHFKAHFPEYLEHYAEQCILFYGGKKSFPEGNPTIHCQDLMNSELAVPLLGETRVKRFQQVRKI
ncbi:MAG TPA: hypothetical protein VNJ01_01325 [Bacteriovoracaceae bacterium]|nr:hypothetical protein [Bacteriovoracaceae bacterium]